MKKIAGTVFMLVLVCALVIPTPIFAKDERGLKLDASDKYVMSASYALMQTIEATIELPKNTDDRAGVIFGNYEADRKACFNFEVHKDGHPRIYITDHSGNTTDIIFTEADVRTGKPVNVAVVYDAAKKSLSLYVDGVLAQTVKKELPKKDIYGLTYRLGGDLRNGNGQYFKGKIYGVAIFDDVRTAAQIKADMTGINTNDSSLVAAWDTSEIITGDHPSKIQDLGPKKRHFGYEESERWLEDASFKGSYDYSFAVIGDTQRVTYHNPDKLSMLYDWVVDNVEKKNIKYVIGLGDITDRNNEWEWEVAKAEITKMNGVVPYSLIRGNHDGIENYKKTFPMSEYKNTVSGTMEGNMLNTYHKFEVEGIKYMILCLDCKYTQKQIDWANKIIADNPNYNVIVTLHIYMTSDGSTSASEAKKYGAQFEAWEMWDLCFKKHANIVMIIGGHSPYDGILLKSAVGENGNVVRQLLIDPQKIDDNEGPTGLVAMFYFSNGGKKVNIDYYSPIKKRYREDGYLSFTLNVVDPPETTSPPETTVAPDTSVAPTESGCGAMVGGFATITSLLACAWVSRKK